MNINNAFPSKYLKSGDVPEHDDLLLTISRVTIETVGQDDPEDKPIVYFAEVDKGLVLNKTNANTIAGLYGPETDGWAGKRIALYATEVAYQGKMTLSLRVRMKAPPAPAPTTNGQSAKAKWDAWCAEHQITQADVEHALGTRIVNEWLKANKEHGGTLETAMDLILTAKAAAAEEPF